MTDYTWTVPSALYQLRWEPSERRASAVAYLTDVIFTGPATSVQDIAYTLLGLNTESDQENAPDPREHMPAGADYPMDPNHGLYMRPEDRIA